MEQYGQSQNKEPFDFGINFFYKNLSNFYFSHFSQIIADFIQPVHNIVWSL